MTYEKVNKIIEHTVVRILSLRLPLVFIEYTSINTYLHTAGPVNLFSIYVPTLSAPEDIKDRFYEELYREMSWRQEASAPWRRQCQGWI